jgi:hypothetical protein
MLGEDVALMITSRLLSGITDRIFAGIISGGSLLGPGVEFVIYVDIAAALSVLAFNKKEMEF